MAGPHRRKTKPAEAGDGDRLQGDTRPSPGEIDRFSAGSSGEVERLPIRRYEAPKGRPAQVREVEGIDRSRHRGGSQDQT
jgi:hypothetical protein